MQTGLAMPLHTRLSPLYVSGEKVVEHKLTRRTKTQHFDVSDLDEMDFKKDFNIYKEPE